MENCKIYEELECIKCDYCANTRKEVDLKEYIINLIDSDIEKLTESLRIFSILTHTTQKQQEDAYKVIFRIQEAEKLKEKALELFKEGR